jgi:hypothetical protein
MFNKVELEKLLGIEHESLPANQEGFKTFLVFVDLCKFCLATENKKSTVF